MDLLKIQNSLDAYLDVVNIEMDGDPQPFGKVADTYQRRDIGGIASALERLIRANAKPPAVRRAMWVRPRGHAKTADCAMLVARVLAFSRRRRRGVWVAADKDQGCEGLDSIATLCRHNPWLDELLTIRADKVENLRTGSILYFTTSDVSSAFGWKDCDLFVMDEVSHWKSHGEALWTAIYSAAGKRSNAIVFALMNAGFNDSWQRKLRDTAAQDDNWAFSELPDAVASWIDQDALADQSKYIPRIAFDRLWRNQWAAAGGDALSAEDIAAAFRADLQPQNRASAEYDYVAGVDLGVSRDASAICTLGVKRRGGHAEYGHIRLAATSFWLPSKNKKVDLLEVERALWDLNERFRLRQLNYDPWEMRHMASLLQSGGMGRMVSGSNRKTKLPMVEIAPVGKNLQAIASAVIEGFADRRIALYNDADLKRDLSKMRVEERSYGYRLTSPRDERGHGDMGTAFGLALLAASELSAKKKITAGTFDNNHRKPPWDRLFARMERRHERDAKHREYIDSIDGRKLDEAQAMADAFGSSYIRGRFHGPNFHKLTLD